MILKLDVPFTSFTMEEVSAIASYYKRNRVYSFGFKSHNLIKVEVYEGVNGYEFHSSATIGLINDMTVLNDYFKFYVVFPETQLMNVELFRVYDQAIARHGDKFNVKRKYAFEVDENDSATLKIFYEKEIDKQ